MTNTETKETWANCQGYLCLAQAKQQDQAFNNWCVDYDRKNGSTAEHNGAFLESEKLLALGVIPDLRLFRSLTQLPFTQDTLEPLAFFLQKNRCPGGSNSTR